MDTHNPHDIDILFIDDDRVLSNVISGYLRSLGYRVSSAVDGQTALELFLCHKPQLIIADLYMPVIDGLRFLEKIREHDSITPVIVTTDNPQLESAIKAIQHGAHDYLQKPFELELLHSKIQHAIKSTRQRRQNAVLSELNALYQVTKNLTEAQDLNQVLQETFRYCFEVSCADGGSIQICDTRSMVLVPLRRKEPLQGSVDAYFQTERSIARWAVANDRSVVLADGLTTLRQSCPCNRCAQGRFWLFLCGSVQKLSV